MKLILKLCISCVAIIAIVGSITDESTATYSGIINNGNGGPGYSGQISITSRRGLIDSLDFYSNLPSGENVISKPGLTVSMSAGGATAYPGSGTVSFLEGGYTWLIWVESDGLTHYIERQ